MDKFLMITFDIQIFFSSMHEANIGDLKLDASHGSYNCKPSSFVVCKQGFSETIKIS